MPGVLESNTDFPIKTDKPVHFGKVRAVYWLTAEDSARLIAEKNYDVSPDAELAVMVISDRISAFDCIWKGENGLNGVPGKGAALNSIANHWFKLFREKGLADSHILDVPHPLVWIVQKAKPVRAPAARRPPRVPHVPRVVARCDALLRVFSPADALPQVMIEAIARQYITGSMWRDYSKGGREICGISIPDGLQKDAKLPELIITPSTKGILTGLPGVPEQDDVNVSPPLRRASLRTAVRQCWRCALGHCV